MPTAEATEGISSMELEGIAEVSSELQPDSSRPRPTIRLAPTRREDKCFAPDRDLQLAVYAWQPRTNWCPCLKGDGIGTLRERRKRVAARRASALGVSGLKGYVASACDYQQVGCPRRSPACLQSHSSARGSVGQSGPCPDLTDGPQAPIAVVPDCQGAPPGYGVRLHRSFRSSCSPSES